MAYLFTNHDKYHLHKTLGLLSIINFVLRFYYAIVYGTSFPSFESKIFSCSSVLVHALLPITSLTIPLPEKRNFTSPMIWKEFRLHSILFSCRHVLFTIITILELWPTQSSALIKIEYRGYALILESIIKYLIIIGCIKIASIITEKYGDKEKRTTNAMLVRKGKCETIHYHRVYSLTLIYPLYLYHIILRRFYSQLADFAICYLYIFSYTMRIKYNWSNMKMWAIVVPLVVSSLIVIPDIEKNLIIDNNITNFIRYYCSIYLIYKEVISDYYIYRGFIPLHMIIK